MHWDYCVIPFLGELLTEIPFRFAPRCFSFFSPSKQVSLPFRNKKSRLPVGISVAESEGLFLDPQMGMELKLQSLAI